MSESVLLQSTILENIYLGVYFIDVNRKIIFWNKAAENITGYSVAEMIGKDCWDDNSIAHLDMNGKTLSNEDSCLFIKAMKEDRLIQADLYIKHKEGFRVPVDMSISPIKTESGLIEGAVAVFNDNVAKMEAFRKIEKLEKLAFVDSLTGVGNRRYTEIKIWTELERIRRYKWAKSFGILFVDIDNFKEFNDKYGHETGDATLKMVSKTLMNNLREKDFVGRWGGEEFVVVVSDVDNKQLYSTAEKMRSLVENSGIDIEGMYKIVTISVGATVAKEQDNLNSLIKRSDALMYFSKEMNRNFVTIG